MARGVHGTHNGINGLSFKMHGKKEKEVVETTGHNPNPQIEVGG